MSKRWKRSCDRWSIAVSPRSSFTIVSPGTNRPSPVDRAFVIVRLAPWSERDVRQSDLVREVLPKLSAVPGVRAVPVNPPGLGQRGFSDPLEVVVAGLDREDVKAWADTMLRRLQENPQLTNVSTDYEETKPQLDVSVDRERAAALGITAEEIGGTLEVMFGSRTVTRFEDRGEQYDVVLQAADDDRAAARDLSNVFVRAGTDGSLVPLSNLVRMEEVAVPPELRRVDRLPAITIEAGLAEGYGLGNAIEEVRRIARRGTADGRPCHLRRPVARICRCGCRRDDRLRARHPDRVPGAGSPV